MWIIEPRRCSRWGRQARAYRRQPVTFTSRIRFSSSGGVSASGLVEPGPGVADQHVQAAERLDRGGHGVGGVAVRPHVRCDEGRPRLPGDAGAAFRVAAGEGDRRALGHKPAHGLGADPRRPARDERRLAGQSWHPRHTTVRAYGERGQRHVGERRAAEHPEGRVHPGHPPRHDVLQPRLRLEGELASGVGQLGAAEGPAPKGDAARAQSQGELLGLAGTGRELLREPRRLDRLGAVQQEQCVELHRAQVEGACDLENRPVKRPDHPQPRRHVM